MRIELDRQHYHDENHRQRMRYDEWAQILLSNMDRISFRGQIRNLVADDLGYGVVEVYKEKM